MKHVLFIGAMLLSAPAFAHVTANPDHGTAGQYFETQLRVSHGCAGSDTVAVSVKLPAGMVSVKPQAKPGWRIEVKTSKLDQPLPAGHGKMADTQVDEIIWRGGPLADNQYDTFGLLMKLPEKAGETLWLPVTQTCVKGTQAWTQIPKEGQMWHDLESPAPFVTLDEAAPMDMGHHH